MNEFYNAEGYYDPTAGKAIRRIGMHSNNEICVGDIYKYGRDGEHVCVVVCAKGDYNVVLRLMDDSSPRCYMGIRVKDMKYADPARLQYVFSDNLTEYIRTLNSDEMDKLIRAIGRELGVPGDGSEELAEANSRISEVETALNEANSRIAELQAALDKPVVNTGISKAELDVIVAKYEGKIELLKEMAGIA